MSRMKPPAYVPSSSSFDSVMNCLSPTMPELGDDIEGVPCPPLGVAYDPPPEDAPGEEEVPMAVALSGSGSAVPAAWER